MRVLVVDDSAFMRRLIARAIDQAAGMRVVATARNGREAVELVREFEPDLITLDWDMPGMDGSATLRGIRELCGVNAPSVLVCSGRSRCPDGNGCGDADSSGFLSKDPAALGKGGEAFCEALVGKLRMLGAARFLLESPCAPQLHSRSRAFTPPDRAGPNNGDLRSFSGFPSSETPKKRAEPESDAQRSVDLPMRHQSR